MSRLTAICLGINTPFSSLPRACSPFSRCREDALPSLPILAQPREIIRRYGAPEDNPVYWRTVSPITYVDRITEPLMIQHGTADESCPVRWTRRTAAALRAAGKDLRLTIYPGEGHNFAAAWPPSMRRTVRFLRAELDA